MSRLARLALTWVLAVALPLHGACAAAMPEAACRTGLHRPAVLPEVPRVEGGSAMAAGHLHGPQAHAAVHAHADIEASLSGKTRSGHEQRHACGVCASCCFGAFASPDPPATLPVLKPPRFYAPFVAQALPAVVEEGLERPPRRFFA